MWHDPIAMISMGSSPTRKRVMSRSCTAISLKIPPPPFTYSNGGGAGSREQSFTYAQTKYKTANNIQTKCVVTYQERNKNLKTVGNAFKHSDQSVK
mmetsp:Transcript_35040/g.46477  ORF Transcript_35040/g.46477 Transcript_35040/m.46477 type:complete len:96 (+) Transcript_35040:699-986(+)